MRVKQGAKSFLMFLSGTIVGGGIGTLVTYKITAKKFLKISDERVKSLEEYIERLQSERLSHDLQYVQESDEDDISDEGSDSGDNEFSDVSLTVEPDGRSRISDIVAQNEKTYVRYSKLSQEGSAVDARYEQIAAQLEHPMDSGEDDEYEREMAEAEEWSEKANSASPPMVIEEHEFGATGYLDEIELYYFTVNKILTNENEEVIPDPERLIGDTITTSGFDSNDERYLYVRNYRTSTDYLIEKIVGSYSDKEIY